MGEIIKFERRSNNTSDSKQEKSKNQSEIYHKAPAWIDKKEENRVDQYQLRRVIKKTLKKFRASPMEREIVDQFIAYLNNSQGQINLADKRYDSAYRYADELGYCLNGIYKGFCGLGRKGVMESHYDHIARRSYRRLSPAFQSALVADMAEQKNKDEQRRNKRSQIAPSQTGRWHLPKREDGHLPKREYKLNQDLELNNTSLIMDGCNSQDHASVEAQPVQAKTNKQPPTKSKNMDIEKTAKKVMGVVRTMADKISCHFGNVKRNGDVYIDYAALNDYVADRFLKDVDGFLRFEKWLKSNSRLIRRQPVEKFNQVVRAWEGYEAANNAKVDIDYNSSFSRRLRDAERDCRLILESH